MLKEMDETTHMTPFRGQIKRGLDEGKSREDAAREHVSEHFPHGPDEEWYPQRADKATVEKLNKAIAAISLAKQEKAREESGVPV